MCHKTQPNQKIDNSYRHIKIGNQWDFFYQRKKKKKTLNSKNELNYFPTIENNVLF